MPKILTLMFTALNGARAVRMAIKVIAALVDPNDATVIALRNAINAISNAIGTSASLSISETQAGVAGDGSYEDNEDKALMRFLDEAGETHTFRVPAPKEAIFEADKETVNPANGLVAAYTAAVIANCVTPQGLAFTSFVGGRRARIDTKAR